MTKISILIPVYNEEKTIIPILEKVKSEQVDKFDFEIIVINDGSTDSSLNLLKKHPELYSKLISLAKNSGKGAAVKAGLKKATGEFVLFQDADLEYDPKDYEKLLLPVKDLGVDIVMGSRIMTPPITKFHYNWNKKGNQFISSLFNFFNNTSFSDIYSCYILYRRSLIDPIKLRTDGWEQQAEILSKIVKKTSKISEVPVSYYGRTYHEGKKIRPYHTIKIVFTIIRERFFSSE